MEEFPDWPGTHPAAGDTYRSLFSRLGEGIVILKPDKEEAEWWAGAPSVVRDGQGTFWMACRMRTADSPRGLRGYEIRFLKSRDGIHFEVVGGIRRDQVPIPGFERPAILIDPETSLFKLYGCGPWKDGPWAIIKWKDAPGLDAIDPGSAYPVIQSIPKRYPRDILPEEYKDPFIFFTGGEFHCHVIGYMRRTERIYHWASSDGEIWKPVGRPEESVMNLDGWHDFFVRPACVVPLGIGYLFVYEGSSTTWYDPVYNVATGLGFTFDLHRVIDLTPDSPLAASPTPGDLFGTFRYSHWLRVEEEMWIYAEVACPNQTNEIRLFRVPMR
ncbi:MAG: hypothetical protein AMXMBFR75_08960 [Candidatus Hinthialibacteria bacterium]|nr:hypothetical protein [bacterium]MBK7496449.1 hypothetical protein [Candidatus Omnitrophota bacterium]MCC6732537.1 hypothetical protein [Candidatus Omnitrophota bacterium]